MAREDMQGQLRTARAKEKQAKRRWRGRQQRQSGPTAASLKSSARKQMMRVFWLADSNLDVTVVCLDHLRHPPPWRECTVLEKTLLLNDVVMHADLDEVESWVDPTVHHKRDGLAQVWIVLIERRTAQWVTRVNRNKGVAPSSQLVYARTWNGLCMAPFQLHPLLLWPRSMNAGRLWAVRWRRRWGATMGSLPLGDVDAPADLLEKALRWMG